MTTCDAAMDALADHREHCVDEMERTRVEVSTSAANEAAWREQITTLALLADALELVQAKVNAIVELLDHDDDLFAGDVPGEL